MFCFVFVSNFCLLFLNEEIQMTNKHGSLIENVDGLNAMNGMRFFWIEQRAIYTTQQ